MYKLYTDKQELFECDIQLEGASLTDSKARLVIETEDISLLFKGKINKGGKCQIPVKRLKGLLGENVKGTINLPSTALVNWFVFARLNLTPEPSILPFVTVTRRRRGI